MKFRMINPLVAESEDRQYSVTVRPSRSYPGFYRMATWHGIHRLDCLESDQAVYPDQARALNIGIKICNEHAEGAPIPYVIEQHENGDGI